MPRPTPKTNLTAQPHRYPLTQRLRPMCPTIPPTRMWPTAAGPPLTSIPQIPRGGRGRAVPVRRASGRSDRLDLVCEGSDRYVFFVPYFRAKASLFFCTWFLNSNSNLSCISLISLRILINSSECFCTLFSSTECSFI